MTIHELSAAQLGQAISSGHLSSREVLAHTQQRLDILNGPINAVVATDMPAAESRAAAADAATARGENWGPLHGVPMTIKDTYDVVGMVTTAGAEEYREYRPQRNADVVQRLLDAGAVIYGKTNTPAYAGDVQTYNTLFGVTSNPWDLARTPGGSSGGAAAALAAGLTPLEIGSDIGGSIRTPSHYCGVVGHKPTHDIVSNIGHVPGPPGTLSPPDLAVCGPMARSAADLALAMRLLVGRPSNEPAGWQLFLPEADATLLAGHRVAIWMDDPSFPIDTATRQRLAALVHQLRDVGVEVVEITEVADTALGEMQDLYLKLLAPVIAADLPAAVLRTMPAAAKVAAVQHRLGKQLSPFVSRYLQGVSGSHVGWIGLNEQRMQMRQRFIEFFGEHDLLITPVTQTQAPLHNNEGELFNRSIDVDGTPRGYLDQMGWIAPPTLCGLPSTSMPVGVVDDLPMNVQVVGPPFADYRTIRFAELFAAHFGAPCRPEGY